MKKYYHYIAIAVLMVFSFYYTEQIASIVLNKNPLMIKINEEKSNYEEQAVNAIIINDYIIPGINGKSVNTKESFSRMHEYNTFNSLYLVFDSVKPSISLIDNKDKIIKQGNPKFKKVSIIFESLNTLTTYFEQENLKFTYLANINTYKSNSNYEIINNEINDYQKLENTLNLNKENKHICVLNTNNKTNCLKSKNYLVEPTLTLTINNLINVKNNLENGSIILIKDNVNLNDLKILLKEIKYKDLELVYLSEIISEENQN